MYPDASTLRPRPTIFPKIVEKLLDIWARVSRNNFPPWLHARGPRLGGIDKGNKCRKELVGRVPSMFNSHARCK